MRQTAIKQRFFVSAALLLISSPWACVLAAQQQGPLPPPPASGTPQPARPPQQPAGPSAAPAKTASDSGNITHESPSLPAEQIIQKFGEREMEFRKERDNYTYTQTFVVHVLDDDGRPDGEYRLTSDILFT